MMAGQMIWSILFLMKFLGVPHDARDLPSRKTALYVNGGHCPYPCTCGTGRDICVGCQECPRQFGEPCSNDHPCDVHQNLICRFKHGDSEGICRESTGVPCIVHNRTYEHGETFTLDCRTQCACQNGTYGCSSLCPQEHISPQGSCHHPRLVEVPNQCCREWMCDSQTAEQPPSCRPTFSKWSPCSSKCGIGLSSRSSNLNALCQTNSEKRICQTRRCQDSMSLNYSKHQHHLRRGHECKATHRLSTAVYLRFGPCRSRKRFRPKYCGLCTTPSVICEPILSTTVKVDFVCEEPQPYEHTSEFLEEYLEPGEELWTETSPFIRDEPHDNHLMTVSVQWILKCRCEAEMEVPTSSTGEVILHRVHRTAAP